ncbi:hypothetical protein SK128_025252 [Halocaridina rubra]|uniref:Uncharacterized protein n=1 Tax=Halocaridina rubra TaxID=373956 RepID=A0AAN8XTC8_HALRR
MFFLLRKGAPFQSAIDRVKDKLIEAGLIDLWLKDLFETYMWRERMLKMMDKASTDGKEQLHAHEVSGYTAAGTKGGVVLNLNHLQGAFSALFLGMFISAVVFTGERLIYPYSHH